MANQLSQDSLRNIASFLEYNDRVSMNVAIRNHEYQYVKKLNSDAHHISYTTKINTKLLADIELMRTPRQKALRITKLLRENSSDRNILLLKNPKYRQAVINKCNEFLSDDFDTAGVHEKVIKSLRTAARRLLRKIEAIQPSEEVAKIKSKIVEII